MNVGIYVYEDAEVLDFSGPFEVFATAARLAPHTALRVFLVAEQAGTLTARGGYRVVAPYGVEDHPHIDVLLVAGGLHERELGKPAVLAWIRRQAASARQVASVCTGAFLLAEAGVLTNQRVTTHWEDISALRRDYPRLNVAEGVRWVVDGNVVTSAGIAAGIDMSLHLVSRLQGAGLAERTARQMEFDWHPGAGAMT